MPAFFLTFLAVAITVLAGREALRVARLRVALGSSAALVAAILVACVAGACAAAWLGRTLAMLVQPSHKLLFVAAALAVAAAEVLLYRDPPTPREPTRSFGAITLVLTASLAFDAAGFVMIAFAAATGEPALAASGGGIGALAALVAALLAGEDWEKLPRRTLRRTVAGVLFAAALALVVQGLA